MTCCDHSGYDGEPFHEYCCRCYDMDERVETMLEDLFDHVLGQSHDSDFTHDLATRCVKLLQEEFVI